MKKTLKVLAAVLAVLMLTTALPIFAEDEQNVETIESEINGYITEGGDVNELVDTLGVSDEAAEIVKTYLSTASSYAIDFLVAILSEDADEANDKLQKIGQLRSALTAKTEAKAAEAAETKAPLKMVKAAAPASNLVDVSGSNWVQCNEIEATKDRVGIKACYINLSTTQYAVYSEEDGGYILVSFSDLIIPKKTVDTAALADTITKVITFIGNACVSESQKGSAGK